MKTKSFLLPALVAVSCLAGFMSDTSRAAAPPKPNIILIFADDVGLGDVHCSGGPFKTPNIDALAVSGTRFENCYAMPLGQAMRGAGYATFAIGKWHLVGNPVERGFDHYFGHLSGASDCFKGNASHRLDDKPFKVPTDGKFYTTDANADYAIKFITDSRQVHPDKPFFLYLAFNAPHGPIQAWPENIAKYRGKYKIGWDKIREQRYQRMIEQGVFKREWSLSPRPATIPAWDSLTEKEKDFEDLRMSIFAAMVDRMDQAIGRVLAQVKALGQESNTLVMFLSDNGGSPYDRGRRGTLPDPGAAWEYGLGWAHVSCAPFLHYKRNMFNGGACPPFIAYWPAEIKQPGTVTDQRGHIIDLMATLMDLAGAPWPKEYDGKPLAALPGKSLRPIFAGETRAPHDVLYFELMDHRAVIAGDWKIAADWGRPWQLFNLANDRTELNDLAAKEPERFKQMTALWDKWWSGKNPGLFKASGAEPTYRRLADNNEASQGGNDEADQAGAAKKKKRKK